MPPNNSAITARCKTCGAEVALVILPQRAGYRYHCVGCGAYTPERERLPEAGQDVRWAGPRRAEPLKLRLPRLEKVR